MEAGRAEFELVDPDEYDFEMKNFMDRFGQLHFSELKTDQDVYQLPLLRSEVPTTTKLEESKMLEEENAQGSSEAEWVAQDDSSNDRSPVEHEELKRLHTQFEQIRQSLWNRSMAMK